jgi:hypothetical protein
MLLLVVISLKMYFVERIQLLIKNKNNFKEENHTIQHRLSGWDSVAVD